jgi:hypothetical protein
MKVTDYTVVIGFAPTLEEANTLLKDGVKRTLASGWFLQGGVSMAIIVNPLNPNQICFHLSQAMVDAAE